MVEIFILMTSAIGCLTIGIKIKTEAEITRMKITELAERFNADLERVLKVQIEVKTKLEDLAKEIETLRTQLEDLDIPAAAETTLATIESVIGAIDQLIPDAPPTPPPAVA